MADDIAAPPDIDAIVEELRERVEDRRRRGVYPEGLEEDMAAHFERVIQFRARSEADLPALLSAVWETLPFSVDRISTESGRAGVERIHRAVERLVARQIEGVLSQTQDNAVAVHHALGGLNDWVLTLVRQMEQSYVRQIDALYEQIADQRRELNRLAARLEEVAQGVAAPAAAAKSQQ